MNQKLKCPFLLILISLFVSCLLTTAEATDPYANETPAQHAKRMEWFRNARFGMFIHWGVYSILAGTYNGKQIPGIGEWIMCNGKIPMTEYQTYAKKFNPVKYNPDEWVRLAKEAGMKYIVITAKHHDGFANFDTKASDWNIAKATPYGKDILKPLAVACRKYGIKLGFYYSQAQDWNNGGSECRGAWDPAQKHDMDDYIDKVAVPQVRELLSNYGEFPAVLWWDTPCDMNKERADKLVELLKLKPGIISNNRLGGGYKGDTETPEQFIPATGFPGRDWEACMTMNDTWGYKSNDHNWKSTETLIRNLVDIVSKGGNYLLNVGPTAEGEIPEPSVQRLKEIGAWIKVNGESIYGTTASPFAKLIWGRCTKKITDKGGVLFFFIFDWPKDGKLLLPGLKNKVTAARVLATGAEVTALASGDDVELTIPTNAPDATASVIKVEFSKPLDILRYLPHPQQDGSIALGAEFADIHNSLNAHAALARKGAATKITDWNNAETTVSWVFQETKTGTYIVRANLENVKGGKLNINLDGKSVPVELLNTNGSGERVTDLGYISILKPGDYTLELKPEKENWKSLELHSVTLVPVEN